mgnify:CR=1
MILNDNSYNVKQAIQAGPTKESFKKQAVNNLFSRLRVKVLSTIIIILLSKIKGVFMFARSRHLLLFVTNSNLASPSIKLVKVRS